ncbi:MAG TPA: YcbK family protein [Alphaproteobacteria bacterium]|nr:YcbK family protein [Alphaproteobacteria bacterium]
MRRGDEGGRPPMWRRRELLKFGAGAAALLLPLPALARTAPRENERTLRLYNLHTGETLKSTFWAQGRYLPEAQAEINRILRDHYSDEVTEIDPALVELLYRIQSGLGAAQGLDVVCGYRSPETNAELVREGRVHARNSYHISGQALDFRVPGRDLRQVRKLALSLRGGGVGYYPRSHFVHVDVGPVRHW